MNEISEAHNDLESFQKLVMRELDRIYDKYPTLIINIEVISQDSFNVGGMPHQKIIAVKPSLKIYPL